MINKVTLILFTETSNWTVFSQLDTGEASESDRESGHSDKESMSDKESDSAVAFQNNGAAETTATAAATINNSNDKIGENKEKDTTRTVKRARRTATAAATKDNIYHIA